MQAYTAADAVRDHSKMVHQCARRYMRKSTVTEAGLTYDDLVQIGMLALCKAVEQYKPGKGANFLTYATTAIWREMSRAIRGGQMVRVPINSDIWIMWTSLDAPAPSIFEDETPRIEMLPSTNVDAYEEWIDEDHIASILTPREMLVAQRRAEAYTLVEIGAELGVTHERVRQMLKQMQRKLLHRGIGWDRVAKNPAI